jgi:anti-anti-sigma factor
VSADPPGQFPGFAAVVIDGTVMAVLSGELDAGTRRPLAHLLRQIAQVKPERIIFEMSGVSFVDCASMRLIADAGLSLPRGTRPVVKDPRHVVRRVLELTGLDALCDITP